MEIIKANPDIFTLNEKFEIIANGKVLKNSNFLEIFESFFGGKKKPSIDRMVGLDHVVKSLKGISESQKFITNSYNKNNLFAPSTSTFESMLVSSEDPSPKSSGSHSSFSSPVKQSGTGKHIPGNNQRILRLYQV